MEIYKVSVALATIKLKLSLTRNLPREVNYWENTCPPAGTLADAADEQSYKPLWLIILQENKTSEVMSLGLKWQRAKRWALRRQHCQHHQVLCWSSTHSGGLPLRKCNPLPLEKCKAKNMNERSLVSLTSALQDLKNDSPENLSLKMTVSSWVLQRILMVQVIWKAEAGECTEPRVQGYNVLCWSMLMFTLGILNVTSQEWGTMGLIRVGRCLGTAWAVWPDLVIKQKDKAVAIVVADVHCASLCNLETTHNTVNVTRHCIHVEQLILAQGLEEASPKAGPIKS